MLDKNIKRNEMFEILEEMGVPYIRVEIKNDHVQRDESPIGELSDTYEKIVNFLISKVVSSKSDEGSHFLAHLQNNLTEFKELIRCIVDKSENGGLQNNETDKNNENENNNNQGIPDIWLEAFE